LSSQPLNISSFPIECGSHFTRELLGAERLGEETDAPAASIAWMKRFLEISRNENDFRRWARLAQPGGEIGSAHLGHHHIGQDKVDWRRAGFADETFGVVPLRGL
jgi:hypothetical protein